ncbi:YdeI/OmpD-associated family protein [Sandarakinorhabdus sp. DWP1-3-1]|uniref:YdeI/OmpD-associated family protein n=1 Tax=Sandarakinorhabdus sp. DWP1-3-1 TaxID=2804627 RepID=UPI003CF4DEB7
MPHDPRVTAYIDKALPFAQPILGHVRGLVHAFLPAATETMKWGMPFFQLNGRDIAMMAAFKAHAGLGIFDGSAMATGDGMGQFGKLASVADLPGDALLVERLNAAAALAQAGRPARPRPPAAPKAPAAVPDDLAAALAAEPAAGAAFAAFPPGARRDYVDWVLGAKQPATRAKRIATTVAQAAEGKKINWKYEKS